MLRQLYGPLVLQISVPSIVTCLFLRILDHQLTPLFEKRPRHQSPPRPSGSTAADPMYLDSLFSFDQKPWSGPAAIPGTDGTDGTDTWQGEVVAAVGSSTSRLNAVAVGPLHRLSQISTYRQVALRQPLSSSTRSHPVPVSVFGTPLSPSTTWRPLRSWVPSLRPFRPGRSAGHNKPRPSIFGVSCPGVQR